MAGNLQPGDFAKTSARCDLALCGITRMGFAPRTTRRTIPGTATVPGSIKTHPRYVSWKRQVPPTTGSTVILS